MNPRPLTYLISGGLTSSSNFSPLLRLAEAAARAGISYFQIREKQLAARDVFDLTVRIVAITRGSKTRVLVNDRADIARLAGADGVHLPASSLPVDIVRRQFGPDFVIGVSTHSVADAILAREQGADFAVLGPIFPTPAKLCFGPPLGSETLREAVCAAAPLPIFALGGVELSNLAECLDAGAAGIAGIRIFSDPGVLEETMAKLTRSAG